MVDVAIDSEDATIPSVCLTDQVSDPAAPSAGFSQVYCKAGVLYVRSSAGIWTPLANPMTTAGDLILGGTSGVAERKAKGNDADVFTIDPATHLPVWAAPAAGAGDFTLIERKTASGGATASFDFQSIPADYADLMLTWRGRALQASNFENFWLRFNNDATNIYDWQMGQANAAVNPGSESFTQAQMFIGALPAANATSGRSGSGTLLVPDYKGTTFHKTANTFSGFAHGTASGNVYAHKIFGVWRSAAAVSRITLWLTNGNIADGSVASLYGLS